MNDLYRALIEYRKAARGGKEYSALLNVLKNGEGNKIRYTVSECKVDDDWINAIQEGLPFIGKAIDEQRQFINSQGEIFPIEKVKRVSKESVSHLAKHSNFIKDKDGEPTPEKLFTVERLNDFAVYENRFLYMLLIMLRDFVSLRSSRIQKEANRFDGELIIDKTVNSDKRNIIFKAQLIDRREDDEILKQKNGLTDVIAKIDDILRSVYFYLKTPLMIEVSKVSKIKPPITKTNILRMDNNFKQAVSLYEFISAYSKPGFTVTTVSKEVDITEKIASELADMAIVGLFIQYKSALDLETRLLCHYEEEESRRIQEQRIRNEERIKAIKALDGNNAFEYISLLEERNDILLKDVERLKDVENRLKELESRAEEIEKERDGMQAATDAAIQKKNDEIDALGGKISDLNGKLSELTAESNGKIASIRTEYENRIDDINTSAAAMIENERTQTEKLCVMLDKRDKEIEELKKELTETKKQKDILGARLTGLRKSNGLLTPEDDYSSKEAFDELERELIALCEVMGGEWEKVKKHLKRDLYKQIAAVVKGKGGGNEG